MGKDFGFTNSNKQIVADAAIKEVKSDMILGLGSGSTAALVKSQMKFVLVNCKI